MHVSTDYVFDGTKTTPYVESDPTGPRSVYGSTKLLGERSVALAAPDRHTIVRSSWLFGNAGPCFPATMLRLAGERDSLNVVDDQVGCPTFTGHLAQALVALATAHTHPGRGSRRRRRRVLLVRVRRRDPPRERRLGRGPAVHAPTSFRARRGGRPTACCAPNGPAVPILPDWRRRPRSPTSNARVTA